MNSEAETYNNEHASGAFSDPLVTLIAYDRSIARIHTHIAHRTSKSFLHYERLIQRIHVEIQLIQLIKFFLFKYEWVISYEWFIMHSNNILLDECIFFFDSNYRHMINYYMITENTSPSHLTSIYFLIKYFIERLSLSHSKTFR